MPFNKFSDSFLLREATNIIDPMNTTEENIHLNEDCVASINFSCL